MDCRGLSNLQKISIHYSAAFNDDSMIPISQCEKLFFLEIVGCKNFTGSGIKRLKSLKHLKILNVSENSNFQDIGAQHAFFLNLEELNLQGNPRITDHAFAHIEEKVELTRLFVSGCKGLTDKCMEDISKLQNLRWLWLGNYKITDKGIEHLNNMNQLCDLRLDYCNITDKSIIHLQRLPALEYLSLIGCKKVSDKEINNLKRLRKGIVIPREYK